MSDLHTTPLTPWHQDHGARLVDFAGWSMPLQYATGVLAEHRAVRAACGLFDVSHMAELAVRGPRARAALDALVTNNVGRLEVGAALYTALCNERGTVLDDLLVYCLDEDYFLVVANAANHAKVRTWLEARLGSDVILVDETAATSLFALQGPTSPQVLAGWTALDRVRAAVQDLDYYRVLQLEIEGTPALLARTGYTGERGYEIYVSRDVARTVWETLLATGTAAGLVPVGLGARDTLRLEAGFALYGQELDEEATPYESGIGWVVKLKKAVDFVGKEALVRQKAEGVPRRSLALRGAGRNIARPGASVLHAGVEVGRVTSGTFSPTLEVPIALARVRAEAAEGPLTVDVRGTEHPMEIVDLPFVPSRVRD